MQVTDVCDKMAKFVGMIVFPNAKINLGLAITGRRPDGYHDIETVMYPVGWSDILEIVPSKSGITELFTSGRSVECPPESNLVMKAYRALDAITPLPPVSIYLHKVIPDGAGLGGGSADAAFTLKALNAMMALGLDDERLEEIAATIGADCPFFIRNRPVTATGTGTTFSPADITLAGYSIVIVKPTGSVSTREAYAGVKSYTSPGRVAEAIVRPLPSWDGCLINDFEASVAAQLPEITAIKQRLTDMGAAYTSMSGSGSAVYGLFEGDILSDNISELFPEADTYIGRLD